MKIKLWSINRWLRYSGFRLFIEIGENEPTMLGIKWYGLPGSRGWKSIEGMVYKNNLKS